MSQMDLFALLKSFGNSVTAVEDRPITIDDLKPFAQACFRDKVSKSYVIRGISQLFIKDERVIPFYKGHHGFIHPELGKIAVNVDDEGVSAACGDSVFHADEVYKFSFDKFMGMLIGMLNDGEYASYETISAARGIVLHDIANTLANVGWDLEDISLEHLPPRERMGFPEYAEKVEKLLSTVKGASDIADDLKALLDDANLGKVKLRWKWCKDNAEKAIDRITYYILTPGCDYSSEIENDPIIPTFTSDDAIEAFLLRRGGSYADSKSRIEQHFSDPNTADDDIKVLCKEFGEGGIGCTEFDADYNSQGLRYATFNCLPIRKSWTWVANIYRQAYGC